MVSRSLPVAVGLVLTLLVAVMLGGCSFFLRPDPPSVVTDAVEEALADLRSTEGVAVATGYASPIDSMWGGDVLDDPDSWIARFTIEAEAAPDLVTLADAIDTTLSAARPTVASVGTLAVAAEGAAPAATLEFSSDPSIAVTDMVVAATVLRALEGSTGISVSTYPWPARVALDSPRRWADAAAQLRATAGFGTGGLRSVSLSAPMTDDGVEGSVVFDAVSPSPSLILAFAAIEATPGIRSARLDGVRAVDLVDEAGTWRPSLWLSADTGAQAEAVAATLVALPDSDTAAPGVPRPRFSVDVLDRRYTVSGYVGLPLGAGAPGDGVPTPPRTPAPPPLDPLVAAERLEAGRDLVATLLDEAGDLAGIRGAAALEVVACADDRGEQVRGSVVVPVFEISDSADDAFATITESWTERGFEYTDRGLGTDIYSAPGLESLTIRGTAEGIRILATAACSAPG